MEHKYVGRGISQNKEYHFGGPHYKDYHISGSVVGSPHVWKHAMAITPPGSQHLLLLLILNKRVLEGIIRIYRYMEDDPGIRGIQELGSGFKKGLLAVTQRERAKSTILSRPGRRLPGVDLIHAVN